MLVFGFWVHVLFSLLPFIISSSAVDCLGRFVSKMTCYVSSGTLNLTNQLTEACESAIAWLVVHFMSLVTALCHVSCGGKR